MIRFLLFLCILASGISGLKAQALIVNPVDPVNNPLVDSLVGKLVGNGVIVENIRSNLNENTRALATFQSDPLLFNGIRSGLMMVTGVADTMAGQNNGIISAQMGGFNYSDTIDGCSSGRQMLNAVLASNSSTTGRTTDCATIQFDIIPATDSIKFNYVFASEEYNTFVCSNFNDIFGFFIRGPGIVGDQSLAANFPNTKNIALIPGTNLPVSINTVNNGTPGSGTPANCTFTPQGTAAYIDNSSLTQADNPFVFSNVKFNGLTTKLQAAVKVIPCQTYTLTLTISDVSDRSYDSGVFIEAGSLRSSGVTLAQTSVFNTRFPYAIVDCNPGKFIFERCSANTINPLIARYKVGGTAVNGVDYKQLRNDGQLVTLPDSFVLAPGQFMDSITLVGLDNPNWQTQSSKNVVIRFLNSSRPYINGQPNFRGDSTVLTIKRKFIYRASDDIAICRGEDSLLLPITESDSRDRYRWVQLSGTDTIPTGSLSCTDCYNPRSFADTSTTYVLFVKDSLSGCVSNDTVLVKVENLPDLKPTTDKPGNIVCPGYPFRLIAKAENYDSTWTYEWVKPVYYTLSSDLKTKIEIRDDSLKQRELTIDEMDIKERSFFVKTRNYLGCSSLDSVRVLLSSTPSFEVSEKLDFCLGDSLILRPSDFTGLFESKISIIDPSRLTIFPDNGTNPKKLETTLLVINRISGDTAVWVKPKVSAENDPLYLMKLQASNCIKSVAIIEGWPSIDSVNLRIKRQSRPALDSFRVINYVDSIESNKLNFESIKAITINSVNCGAFVPNLVLINGEIDRNQGFFIFQITSDKNSPGKWPFLNGGSLKIFNRWGKQVYASDNYNNELSYEKLKSDYQDGVYFYEYNNSEINFKRSGYFNLQR